MKRLANVGLLALLSLGVASRAAYGMAIQISITDGTTVTVTDNNAVAVSCVGPSCAGVSLVGDTVASAGAVNYSTSIGSWIVVTELGVGKPLTGSASAPEMHLHVSGTSLAAATTLTLRFTDTGFTPLAPGYVFNGSGTVNPGDAGASMTAKTWADGPGNLPFAQTTLLDSHGPFGQPGFLFGPSGSIGVPGGAPYSLTMIETIVHGKSGTSSSDYDLQTVPEPASILLLGSGLAGFGYLRRRNRGKVTK